jgi:hypothetical protein
MQILVKPFFILCFFPFKSSEVFTKGFLNPNIKNKLDNFLKDEINLTTSDINKATKSLLSSNILLDYSIEKYLVCLLFVA